MSRGFFNWTFREIDRFLKENGFSFLRAEGSHYHYLGNTGGQTRLVQVPFHGNSKSINPRTFKSIIQQSGIPKKSWLEW